MKVYTQIFILTLACCLFVGCKHDDADMGLDIVNPKDRLSSDLYLGGHVEASTQREKNLVTSGFRTYVLGEYQDMVFGSVKSQIYTQLSLSASVVGFDPSEHTLDSVVLTLACNGFFSKDSVCEMQVVIEELMEDMSKDSAYTSDRHLTTGTKLFDQTVRVEPSRMVDQDGKKGQARLQITLNKTIMAKFLKQYTDNADFQQQFKGLKLTATPDNLSTNGGMMLYLDFWSEVSGLSFFYQKNERTSFDRFVFDKGSARFMNIEHPFEHFPLNEFASNPEASIEGKHALYLQTSGATKIKLSLSQFDTLKGLSINRATLILPVSDAILGNTPKPPSKIMACSYEQDEKGDSTFLPIYDYHVSASHYGGVYDARKKEYRISITSYLQNLLNGNLKDPNIYLIPDMRRATANRVVLNGTADPSNPLRIEVLYTR